VSLKYSLTFLSLAIAVGGVGLVGGSVWLKALLTYAGLSLTVVAVAYGGVGPSLLLKRSDGQRSPWAWTLLGPYFLLCEASFRLARTLSREPAFAQVTPHLYFGRRLVGQECGEVAWAGVIDLAAELGEASAFRSLPGYRCLPVLDATAPAEEQIRLAVSWLQAIESQGPVYVHCALGHGRSACVVIAYLLTTGEVESAELGELRLRALRPNVRLHPCQMERLRAFESRNVSGK
jgi:hypothetical protein